MLAWRVTTLLFSKYRKEKNAHYSLECYLPMLIELATIVSSVEFCCFARNPKVPGSSPDFGIFFLSLFPLFFILFFLSFPFISFFLFSIPFIYFFSLTFLPLTLFPSFYFPLIPLTFFFLFLPFFLFHSLSSISFFPFLVSFFLSSSCFVQILNLPFSFGLQLYRSIIFPLYAFF